MWAFTRKEPHHPVITEITARQCLTRLFQLEKGDEGKATADAAAPPSQAARRGCQAEASASQDPCQPSPATASQRRPGGLRLSHLGFASLQLLLSLFVLHSFCGEGWGEHRQGVGDGKARSVPTGVGPQAPRRRAQGRAGRSPLPERNQAARSLADRPQPHGPRRHHRRHLRLHVNTRRNGRGEHVVCAAAANPAAPGRCAGGPAPPRRGPAPPVAAPPAPRPPRRPPPDLPPAAPTGGNPALGGARFPRGACRSAGGGLAEEVGERALCQERRSDPHRRPRDSVVLFRTFEIFPVSEQRRKYRCLTLKLVNAEKPQRKRRGRRRDWVGEVSHRMTIFQPRLTGQPGGLAGRPVAFTPS